MAFYSEGMRWTLAHSKCCFLVCLVQKPPGHSWKRTGAVVGGEGEGWGAGESPPLPFLCEESLPRFQDVLLAVTLGRVFVLLGDECHVQPVESGSGQVVSWIYSFSKYLPSAVCVWGAVCCVPVRMIHCNVCGSWCLSVFESGEVQTLGHRVPDPQSLHPARPRPQMPCLWITVTAVASGEEVLQRWLLGKHGWCVRVHACVCSKRTVRALADRLVHFFNT